MLEIYNKECKILLDGVDEEIIEIIADIAERMYINNIIKPNIDLIVKQGNSTTTVVRPYGLDELGNEPYSYAVARNKTTHEKINIVTYNIEIDSILDIFPNIALGIGDVLSHLCEKEYLNEKSEEDDEENEERVTTLDLLRSSIAVLLAELLLHRFNDDIAIYLGYRFNLSNFDTYDKIIEDSIKIGESSISIASMLLEMIAHCYTEGTSITEYYKSYHITFKSFLNLEKAVVKAYNEIGFKPGHEDYEATLNKLSENTINEVMEALESLIRIL